MPGSIVSEITDFAFDISTKGNILELSCREGTVASYEATLINGAWNSASLSVKKTYGAGQARAFGTPVAITADGSLDSMDTTGASGIRVTVDTASGTSNSYIILRLTCKGDRLDSPTQVLGATRGDGDLTFPDGGGSLFP